MKGAKRLCLVLMTISVLVIKANGDDPPAGAPVTSDNSKKYTPGKVNCFQCEGWSGDGCNAKSGGGIPIPSENCLNPNDLAKEWVKKVSGKLGKVIGDIDLTTFTTNVGNEVEQQANLQNLPGCAFFLGSTENVFTNGVDNLIKKSRSMFGDANAGKSIAVQKFVKRDCVTIRTREEMKAEADRCVTIPAKGVFTVLLCTCTTDKCNEGIESPYLKGLISRAVGSEGGSGQMSNHYNTKFLISTTFLSAYLIHIFY